MSEYWVPNIEYYAHSAQLDFDKIDIFHTILYCKVQGTCTGTVYMEGLEGLSAQELIAKRDGIEQELREQLSILDQVREYS